MGTDGRFGIHAARLVCRRIDCHELLPGQSVDGSLAILFSALVDRADVLQLFGCGIALVATKGVMVYDVPAEQLGRASGFYTAGGIVAKSVAGAGTLWLLGHVSSRPLVSGLSVGAAALGMSAIVLASPGVSLPVSKLVPALRAALSDVWNFVWTRGGALVAVLCIIPFGTSTLLANAIAREWSVTPDQLSAAIPVGAALSVAGAMLAGRLSVRFGPWKTYVAMGWILIVLLIAMAFALVRPDSSLLCCFCIGLAAELATPHDWGS